MRKRSIFFLWRVYDLAGVIRVFAPVIEIAAPGGYLGASRYGDDQPQLPRLDLNRRPIGFRSHPDVSAA